MAWFADSQRTLIYWKSYILPRMHTYPFSPYALGSVSTQPNRNYYAGSYNEGKWIGYYASASGVSGYAQTIGGRMAWHLLEKAAGIDKGAPNSKDCPDWPGYEKHGQ